MIPARQQQRPQTPITDLHHAVCDGSAERTIALLSRESTNIDQCDRNGWTPLMYAAQEGHSRVAKILLGRRANVAISADGFTALHVAAQYGHLPITADLIKAGADVDARDFAGVTPLMMAAYDGHRLVIAALIEAGADVDSRGEDGGTALHVAALNGQLDAVKELLRANANLLLTMKISSSRLTPVPLDVAAKHGRYEVVRELIQHAGIEGCVGGSGGQLALVAAAQNQHLDVVGALMDAGVVDEGAALFNAAACGREASVKFLLQERRRRGITAVDYVNSRDAAGMTALFQSIDVYPGNDGAPRLISPKVLWLLIDAGADTSSAVRVTCTPGGVAIFNGTPLAFTINCLRNKQLRGGRAATEEQMYRLEAVRRLLLRVEAVHAVSWLWVRQPLLVGDAEDVSRGRTARKTAASGTQLASILPILRRRRRGVLLAPLFRYLSLP